MQSKSLYGWAALFSVFIFPAILYSQESFFHQLPGWHIIQDDPVYTSNNLWDIIDGAADLYLEYGFVDLHIARWINTDSIEVKVELYRHDSDVDAFGMYSQERDTGYNFIPLGVQGYLQQGVLNFLTGSTYIKLSTYQTGNKAQEAMLTIGRILLKHLSQNNMMPGLFRVFPKIGKLANTEQYVARNFLGYSFMNSAYVVTYRNRLSFKVFVIPSATPEKAGAVVEDYLNAIPKDSVTKIDADAYLIRDPHNGMIGVRRSDRYIIGIINCEDGMVRDKNLNELNANLLK